MRSKPHISPALASLRGWVSFAAATVALCACIKLVIFGFVHYTDVRYTNLEPGEAAASMAVVGQQKDHSPSVRRIENGRVIMDAAPVVDANRVLSRGNTNMKHASAFACGSGILAAMLLAFVSTLGCAVAAGGGVPGVGRVVNACVWSVILLLFCLPWPEFSSSVPIPGAFSSYAAVVAASTEATAKGGGAALHASYVLVPMFVFACAVGVAWSFRRGVEAGIIVTSVSEFDRAIDQELAALQDRGIAPRQGKAIGALYRVMGENVDSSGPAEPREPGPTEPGRPLPRPI